MIENTIQINKNLMVQYLQVKQMLKTVKNQNNREVRAFLLRLGAKFYRSINEFETARKCLFFVLDIYQENHPYRKFVNEDLEKISKAEKEINGNNGDHDINFYNDDDDDDDKFSQNKNEEEDEKRISLLTNHYENKIQSRLKKES